MNIENLSLPQSPSRADEVEALAALAEAADGTAPLSEQFLLGLRDGRVGHRHLVAFVEGEVVGAAACDGNSAELVVAPLHRGRGVGQALYAALADARPGVQVWAHGNLPVARALAARNGLSTVRRLLVMEISGSALAEAASLDALTAVPCTPLNYADSVDRWGAEHVESEWLRSNNEAFSWHPEQGGWDRERLHRGMEADWFDPKDVLFLWDERAGEAGAVMAGFHWTKWHAEEEPGFGEVYVVGLAQAYRGRKLGGPLLKLGLDRMVRKGAERVILYVEADNEPAIKAYERLGFVVAEEHCVWAKDVQNGSRSLKRD